MTEKEKKIVWFLAQSYKILETGFENKPSKRRM
jgi:hypothetical protein